jgi:hypothetical protein
MHNRYIIQTNIKPEEFFNKNLDLEIKPEYVKGYKYSVRDKFKNDMYLSCGMDGTFNSMVLNSPFNPNYVLYLLVIEGEATILPAIGFQMRPTEGGIFDPIDIESSKHPLNKEFTKSFKKYIEETMDFLPEDIFLVERLLNLP